MPPAQLARVESTEFNCSHLEIRRLSGQETIGAPFALDLEVVALDRDGLTVDAAIGAELTLILAPAAGGAPREIRCIVTDIEDRLEASASFRSYRMRLAPPASKLSFVETLDIFLDATVPEIVEQKLGLLRLDSAFHERFVSSYPKREIVVQYAESDLSFVSRLCEHVGISLVYWDDGSVVAVDHNGGFLELAEPLHYRGGGEKTGVYALSQRSTTVPAIYIVRDYNYRTPLVDLSGTFEGQGAFGGLLEYGGHFKTPEEACSLARVRAEERLCRAKTFHGKSDIMLLGAGRVGRIEGHPIAPDSDVLFVEVRHHLEQATSVDFDSPIRKRPSRDRTAIPRSTCCSRFLTSGSTQWYPAG